ncbi:MAG: IclR family transcriptional regulator [Pseudomonadota bacterium]
MSVRPLTTAIQCFEMLELIAAEARPVRLADVARLVGKSRATTFQRLLTLVTAGWVERLPGDTYRLSLTASRIANAALDQAGFDERALPVLQDLTQATGETSSLVALENGRPVIVQRVEARGVLRADLKVGAELSLTDSASGKIWLTFGPEAALSRIDPASAALLKETERASIRAERVAQGGGGDTLKGIAVIAAPVLGAKGEAIASLSLVGPESRFDSDALKAPLIRAAETLGAVLGGRTGSARLPNSQ